MSALERSVEFDGVSFAYDGDPVLQDISFTAPRGAVVALVARAGQEGTLVDLIPRYEPKGAVFV